MDLCNPWNSLEPLGLAVKKISVWGVVGGDFSNREERISGKLLIFNCLDYFLV